MLGRLLKSVLVGLCGTLAAVAVTFLATVAEASFRLWLMTRTESAGIGAVSVAIPGFAVLAAPVGFVIGFYWQFRRGEGAR